MKETNKNFWIFLVIVVILFVGAYIIYNNDQKAKTKVLEKTEKASETEKVEKAEDKEKTENIDNNTKKTNVISVNEKNFKEEVLESDKKVLVDFYADWCPPCKILSPVIEEMSLEYEDIKFVKVDVDSNNNLSNKYDIVSIPTLIVFENGEEVDKAVGALPKDSIKKLLEI